jgi:catechol 2,3-dioxygenase-like lactoylglutathione lyase family enzyme
MTRKPAKKRVVRRSPKARAAVLASRRRAARLMASIKAQPLIAVTDVRASAQWYKTLLGATGLAVGSDHDHIYDRLYCGDRLILQLHSWDDEDHPNLVDPHRAPCGHGVLLWFEVADFDAAVARARALRAEIVLEPHVNPAPRHREVWLRDRDGYVVVLASPDGEAG